MFVWIMFIRVCQTEKALQHSIHYLGRMISVSCRITKSLIQAAYDTNLGTNIIWLTLQGMARYAVQLLAPAEGFGLQSVMLFWLIIVYSSNLINVYK